MPIRNLFRLFIRPRAKCIYQIDPLMKVVFKVFEDQLKNAPR